MVRSDVHRIAVPTPFQIGAVNVYLLEGDPLTLVDTGPRTAAAVATIERALAGQGRRVEDLELLLLTHQHVDHVGLARHLAERSGAAVAALDTLAPFLADFSGRTAAEDAFAADQMRRHGFDQDTSAMAALVRGLGDSVTVTQPLRAGSVVRAGGRDLRVLHRPGHSPTDTVFHDEADGLLLAGDHLLSKQASAAIVSTSGARPLVDYRRSLLATRALEFDYALGGHDDPVPGHRGLIDRRVARQDTRARDVLGTLRDGPRTAHEIAAALFGRAAVTRGYLSLSEVLGHLDLLADAGVVVTVDSDSGTAGPAVRFARSGADCGT